MRLVRIFAAHEPGMNVRSNYVHILEQLRENPGIIGDGNSKLVCVCMMLRCAISCSADAESLWAELSVPKRRGAPLVCSLEVTFSRIMFNYVERYDVLQYFS